MSCAVMKATRKNGITSVKILRVPVSLIRQRIGPIREGSFTLTAPDLQEHRRVACVLCPPLAIHKRRARSDAALLEDAHKAVSTGIRFKRVG